MVFSNVFIVFRYGFVIQASVQASVFRAFIYDRWCYIVESVIF